MGTASESGWQSDDGRVDGLLSHARSWDRFRPSVVGWAMDASPLDR